MATLTQLESLLRHAAMGDLAEKVAVWSTESIRAAAQARPTFTAALGNWFAEWAGATSLDDLED